MHSALGNHVGDFPTGKATAEEALAAAEADYTIGAKGQGLIK